METVAVVTPVTHDQMRSQVLGRTEDECAVELQ